MRNVYEDKTCKHFSDSLKSAIINVAINLVDVISTALNSFSHVTDKLMSQAYDGAVVMAGKLSGVKNKLRDKKFKHAHFIHCYTHELNLVLSKIIEKMSGVKVYSSHLRVYSIYIQTA